MEEPVHEPALDGMPDKLLNLITQDFDLKSLYNLNKTSHHLRSYITRIKLPSLYERLSFSVESQNITVHHYIGDGYFSVVYRKHPNGCLVELDDNINLIDDGDHVNVFLHDFGMILSHQLQPLKSLEIKQGTENTENLDQNQFPRVLNALQAILTARVIPLTVEKLIIHAKNQEQIMKILPNLAPGALKSMVFGHPYGARLQNTPLELEEIRETFQWKMAEEMECYREIKKEAVHEFVHFRRAHLVVEEVTEDVLLGIKEIFIDTPHLHYLHLHYPSTDSYLLLQTFDRPFMIKNYDNGSPQKWFYECKLHGKILEIFHPTFTPYMEFKRIEKEDVPKPAIVVRLKTRMRK